MRGVSNFHLGFRVGGTSGEDFQISLRMHNQVGGLGMGFGIIEPTDVGVSLKIQIWFQGGWGILGRILRSVSRFIFRFEVQGWG